MNCNPEIPPYSLAFYEVTVDEEARLALRSFLAYGRSISSRSDGARCAGYLHDALSHCAALSRYFWPSSSAGEFGKIRGELLRKRYLIDDHSPLSNRSLRNALEHFDERLDQWVQRDPVGPIIASPVIADHGIGDDGIGHAFKVIDPAKDIFVILGQKFDFGALCRAVATIVEPGSYEE